MEVHAPDWAGFWVAISVALGLLAATVGAHRIGRLLLGVGSYASFVVAGFILTAPTNVSLVSKLGLLFLITCLVVVFAWQPARRFLRESESKTDSTNVASAPTPATNPSDEPAPFALPQPAPVPVPALRTSEKTPLTLPGVAEAQASKMADRLLEFVKRRNWDHPLGILAPTVQGRGPMSVFVPALLSIADDARASATAYDGATLALYASRYHDNVIEIRFAIANPKVPTDPTKDALILDGPTCVADIKIIGWYLRELVIAPKVVEAPEQGVPVTIKSATGATSPGPSGGITNGAGAPLDESTLTAINTRTGEVSVVAKSLGIASDVEQTDYLLMTIDLFARNRGSETMWLSALQDPANRFGRPWPPQDRQIDYVRAIQLLAERGAVQIIETKPHRWVDLNGIGFNEDVQFERLNRPIQLPAPGPRRTPTHAEAQRQEANALARRIRHYVATEDAANPAPTPFTPSKAEDADARFLIDQMSRDKQRQYEGRLFRSSMQFHLDFVTDVYTLRNAIAEEDGVQDAALDDVLRNRKTLQVDRATMLLIADRFDALAKEIPDDV